MVFHWSVSDSKSPQVSRNLLRILATFNNAVVWMVSARPPTSKSSSPFNNPLVTVPKTPIIIGIIVTFRLHRFFKSLARSRYLSFFSHSLSFILWSAGTDRLLILVFFSRTEKAMEYGDKAIADRFLGIDRKSLGKSGGAENQRKNRDQLDCIIINLDSPENLRNLLSL